VSKAVAAPAALGSDSRPFPTPGSRQHGYGKSQRITSGRIPGLYQLAVDRLAIPAGAISFQSSNAWDAYAASAFGMCVVWCNRYGQRPERLPGKPDREIASLGELPVLVGA
jgi:hypothetical protein